MDFELFYETSGVCTDTRKITLDCLFICLKGDNFNGNTFAVQALEMGARYVIVDEPGHAGHAQIFQVADALTYLQQLANYHRRKFSIPVLGITGSNGKTTSKELISAVLSQKYSLHFTAGNLNNHIGVPLTLLGLNSTHEIAVIEMGANKFGDIRELCEIAEPTHGIITNIGKAHLEGFLNFEGVLKTKRELYESIAQHQGTIFFNADDEILCEALPTGVNTFSYAADANAAVTGRLLVLNPYVSMTWQTEMHTSEAIQTQMIGKYNFYNFLAAISIGTFFDVEPGAISAAIAGYTPVNNRSQIRRTAKNTLIMDAYNANPTSMKSALESFAFIEHQNKLAILGDMFELGAESATEHAKIIALTESLGIHALFVGERFAALLTDSSVLHFANKEAAATYLSQTQPADQLILLKGSRGIGLESLVDLL
jgi:UDP-N-acetylmuramoyl-tripeptide--D-alanyl-D-alanine ligase